MAGLESAPRLHTLANRRNQPKDIVVTWGRTKYGSGSHLTLPNLQPRTPGTPHPVGELLVPCLELDGEPRPALPTDPLSARSSRSPSTVGAVADAI